MHWDGDKGRLQHGRRRAAEQYAVRHVLLADLRGHGPRQGRDAGHHARSPNQPDGYNNVSPIYGTDDRIIFTSDRPRDGERAPLPAARRVRGSADDDRALEPRSERPATCSC